MNWLSNLLAWVIDRPFSVGTVFDATYEVDEVLGMGSYGISYLCSKVKDGEKCVVKQVKPSIRNQRKGRNAYDYERSLLAQLDHPSFPKYLGEFTHRRQLMFAMSYIPGKNLEDHIFDEGFTYSEREAAELLLKLLEIVELLHAQNIIHRDIRLPNLIVHEGELCLIDFGLARHAGDDASWELQPNDPIEKQLRRRVDVTSDLYAIGHLFLFLLYTTYEQKEDEQASWEEELVNLQPLTRTVIRRLLQLENPFASAVELREDLQRIVDTRI